MNPVVNISLKVTSFGQIVIELGKLAPQRIEPPLMPVYEEIRYHEPLETASRVFEVQYEQEEGNYVVPSSTA